MVPALRETYESVEVSRVEHFDQYLPIAASSTSIVVHSVWV